MNVPRPFLNNDIKYRDKKHHNTISPRHFPKHKVYFSYDICEHNQL